MARVRGRLVENGRSARSAGGKVRWDPMVDDLGEGFISREMKIRKVLIRKLAIMSISRSVSLKKSLQQTIQESSTEHQ